MELFTRNVLTESMVLATNELVTNNVEVVSVDATRFLVTTEERDCMELARMVLTESIVLAVSVLFTRISLTESIVLIVSVLLIVA